ncbi:hypothetical protein [Pseudomonas sp. COW5]|uniref:hypothetical protein n=1 Tax=Pseudomonas sp. COW5 TaxID=2981253 RepID=UPI002245D065|nr:hypothetical protein [Pseudomonas sp. COW5]MCX2545745.1 hypothetical protein [Pseudomonas sp. COW5]
MGNSSSSSKKANQPAALLSLLRTNPEAFFGSHAVIVRGGSITADCNVSPVSTTNESVLQLDVTSTGIDWYIPYKHFGAGFVDVPKGQDTGTLIVTCSMNGCALSVHETATGNRFYHDADGKNMPSPLPDGVHPIAKFRRTDADFTGGESTAIQEFLAQAKKLAEAVVDGEAEFVNTWYEHTIISVKTDKGWDVYRSTVTMWGTKYVWLNKNVPLLGSFLD